MFWKVRAMPAASVWCGSAAVMSVPSSRIWPCVAGNTPQTRFTVVDSHIDYEIARGSREIHIPEDTMHSFDGGNNKIGWYLKVAGDVPRWPDVDDEVPVDILPSIPEGGER